MRHERGFALLALLATTFVLLTVATLMWQSNAVWQQLAREGRERAALRTHVRAVVRYHQQWLTQYFNQIKEKQEISFASHNRMMVTCTPYGNDALFCHLTGQYTKRVYEAAWYLRRIGAQAIASHTTLSC